MRKWLFLLALVGGLVVMPSSPALCAGKIELEEGKIEGKIVRPEMSLILHRAKIDYDTLRTNYDFLKKVVEAVEKEDVLH